MGYSRAECPLVGGGTCVRRCSGCLLMRKTAKTPATSTWPPPLPPDALCPWFQPSEHLFLKACLEVFPHGVDQAGLGDGSHPEPHLVFRLSTLDPPGLDRRDPISPGCTGGAAIDGRVVQEPVTRDGGI